MKKTVMVVLMLTALCGAAIAGGPVSFQPVPEKSAVEKPKMTAVEFSYDDLSKLSEHWTIGIGLGGTTMIGKVWKDGIGYPSSEIGFTSLLGIGFTWYSGQPSDAQIKDALAKIRSEKGAMVAVDDLPAMVRDATGVTTLNYLELGTVALIVPLNAEMGTQWILSDNLRTRLGFGLPTLISFGVNYDF